jgi:hypothetical protein
MKNYKKIFEKEESIGDKILSQQKKLKEIKTKREKKIEKYLFEVFLLFYFVYLIVDLLKNLNANQRLIMMLIGLIVLISLYYKLLDLICSYRNKLINKEILNNNKILEIKAQRFAREVFVKDLVSELKKKLQVNENLEILLKKKVDQLQWFNGSEFQTNAWNLKYKSSKNSEIFTKNLIIIKEEGNEFQLENWTYKEEIFNFFFIKKRFK